MSHLTHDQNDSRNIGVTHLLKGLGPGGAERLVLNQLQTSKGGIDYSVLRLIDEKDHLVKDVEATGATVDLIGGSVAKDAGFVPVALIKALRKRRPDVVHAHSPVLAAQVRILSRLGLIDAHVITTEHNRWPRHHKATRVANRITAPLDSARFAVSNDVLNSMDSRLHESTTALGHGVPIAVIQRLLSQREQVRSDFQLASNTVAIGIVANFRPEKSYDVFLKAAIAAVEQNPNIHFVVIGQGPGEAAFRSAVQQSSTPNAITIVGYRPDAVEAMAAFDVFTLSSKHEGKPVSIMEAMALGVPIAATRAGGIPEMVTNYQTGLLVDIGDDQGLANAYLELAQNHELRASLGKAAATYAASCFDASRSTKSIESVYRSITSSG